VDFEAFTALNASEERWRDVTRLPWDDEAFSARMLREHLSQAHDGASRRFETIDRQVRWIHEIVLVGEPARVFDIGCGPGLYGSRLAALGHTYTGIDIGPASIAYAREHASDHEQYVLGDATKTAHDGGTDLVMMVHGEFNVLSRDGVPSLLKRAREALTDGGRLLLEVHRLAAVQAIGQRPRAWMAMASGLFSDAPHLRLDESRWIAESKTAQNLHWIIDSTTRDVRRYGTTTLGYDDDEYRSLLRNAMFTQVVEHPSLDGGDGDANYLVMLAT
jgi:SAM-dependent methyltransferase